MVSRQEEALDDEMTAYRSLVFADATKRNYTSQLHSYVRFCKYFEYELLPATTLQICRYAVFLARTLKPSSVRQYLNIIRIIHLDNGYENPFANNWKVTSLLKGIDRAKGTPPAQKLPILPEHLLQIKYMLNLDNHFDKVLWAACLVGFFGFLRKANLLPRLGKGNTKSYIKREDIEFTQVGMVLSLKQTKTIQCGERVLHIPMVDYDGELSPVKAVRDLFTTFPEIDAHNPLFSYVSSGKIKVLDYSTFTKALKRVMIACGYDPKLYTGHSLRRGGSSYAFHSGIPPYYIKLQGDWRSMAWERYVHIPLSERWNFAKEFIKDLPE